MTWLQLFLISGGGTVKLLNNASKQISMKSSNSYSWTATKKCIASIVVANTQGYGSWTEGIYTVTVNGTNQAWQETNGTTYAGGYRRMVIALNKGDTCIVSKAYLESDGFCIITFVAVG